MSEVIPQSYLIERVIPFTRIANINGEVSLTGDPSTDRKKIITVGIPAGLCERLREQASQYAGDGMGESKVYENSSLINIKIFKKDLDVGNVYYYPMNFLFDTSLWVNPGIQSVESITSDIFGGTGWYSPSEVEYDTADQETELLQGMGWVYCHIPPRGDGPAATGASGNLYSSYDLESNLRIVSNKFDSDEVFKNHAYDRFLKSYIKLMSGLDVNENKFNLFKDATSTQSDVSSGVGNNVTAIAEALSGYADLSSSELDNQENDTMKLDILKILKHGITNSILGDFSPSTYTADRIVACARQTYALSSDKYINQIYLPQIFDRIFCMIIDPDAFVLSGETDDGGSDFLGDLSSAGIDVDYKSELFNIYATVEIVSTTDATAYTSTNIDDGKFTT